MFNVNGITIISLEKDHFSECVFTVLVYRKQVKSMNEFCSLLEYLLVANSADVIAGDFNQHLSNLVKYTFSQI